MWHLLMRDRSDGWLFGVCAGLARATGFSPTIFRTAFVMGLYFATLSTLLLYGLLVVVTRSHRPDYPPAVRDTSIGPLAANDPEATALRYEVEALNQRLAQLEAAGVSRHSSTLRRFMDAGL
jgi:phage shock protein PspC (stress-responsive transcriptional regulator)